MVNIDKKILEFCKEPKKYGEIASLHKELDRSESTIKKHISKLRDREYLIQDNLTKEYQTNPHIEHLDDHLKRQIIVGVENESKFIGLENEVFLKLMRHKSCRIAIKLPKCLTNFYFSDQQQFEITKKVFELLELTVFENLTFYDQIKKPDDYDFQFSIVFIDGGYKDRFNLFREYHKETIKRKLKTQK